LNSTAVATTPEAGERKELRDVLTKLGDVAKVELKLNVPAEQRMSLRRLRIDPLQGRLREVVFFDTPELTLFKAGIAIRGRRTQNKDDDTVAKLRPCVPAELPPALRDSPNLKVEIDVSRRSHVVSASLKGKRPAGTLTDVLAGAVSLENFLSSEQRSLVSNRMPAGVGWADLVPLGPTYVVVVKAVPEGSDHKMTVEVWHFPGQVPLVELSTKALPSDVFPVQKEMAEYLEARGLRATGEQEPKTRKALQFFATHPAEPA